MGDSDLAGFRQYFFDIIPKTAAACDPDRPYWPGSPHHPLDRERKSPDYESASGDAHLWDVWHGGEPFSWYVKNVNFRFVSEFGFQSLPHMETIRSFTAPEDCYFISPVLDHHNLAGKKSQGNENIGNIRIATYVATNFKMPNSFENWVYVSQVMHGEGMKMACEAYRHNFPRTTGALYWQLNDNWPTISGSSIDYYGRWKALQYMTRHFFSLVLITGWAEGTKVKIWGVNDRIEDTPAKLKWTLAGFDGTIIKTEEMDVVLPSNSSSLLLDMDFHDQVGENPEFITYRKDSYENRRKYYLCYQLAQGEKVLSSNVSFFVPQKYLALEEPNLKYDLLNCDGQWHIAITCERFAAYVELGLKNGYARFSDNYFHLLPGESKEITIIESEIPAEEIQNQFYAKSLIDSYR